MTLDEAIRREFLIAANEIREYDGDNDEIRLSALYHKQLADWLKELKSYREHNSIPASSENRVKLEHIECEDAVSRSEILSYIDRIQSQGTGKQKSFEFIQKYVEKMQSVKPKLPECEDAVSRTDVFNAICEEERGGYVDVTVEYMLEVMSNLPSVVPKRKIGNMIEPADRWEPKDVPDTNVGDTVSRSYLLSEYDRQHKGPAGGARKIIEDAPSVVPNINDGDMISRQAAIDEWKNDFKGYVNALNIPRDDYNGIMEYIDELPSAQTELEDKIRAIGYTGKEGRIYIGGRLFAVRELPQ